MFYHYYPTSEWLEPIAKIGWTGVDLFFVLSGYLIGSQLLKEVHKAKTISFHNFYIKRFFRIIPAFLVVLLLYYLLPNWREGSGMAPLWKYLTFTQNLGLSVENSSSFSHAWSLCIEEQFYLLLPLTILLIYKFRLQSRAIFIIASLFILGLLLRIHSWNEYVQPLLNINNGREMARRFFETIYYPSYTRMDGLLVGICIAALLIAKPKIKIYLLNKGNFLLFIGILLLSTAFLLNEDLISYTNAVYGLPMISIAYGFIVLAAISPTCILYKVKSRVTFILATISYSVYLSHKLLFHILRSGIGDLGLELPPNLVFLVCLILAIIIGLVLHLLVEKPFLNLRIRLLKNTESEAKLS
jgi:peptidoglycan/LPS O-acetylase OafA/YrhL